MGKISVTGIGPGDADNMTARAKRAIADADVVVGYDKYINLLGGLCAGKEVFMSGMMGERARAQKALEYAGNDRNVAMVCSGDAGIYGMAGLLMEMRPDADIEVIPGITAAISGAAVLGAPLMNDFCVISLSDRLTPWEIIEKRLSCAAMSDMVIVLYNPRSKQRAEHLKKACEIILKHRDEQTVCGWVKNIGRDGQESHILTLKELKDAPLDMFCTAFIGSSETVILGDRMVTKRGYGV